MEYVREKVVQVWHEKISHKDDRRVYINKKKKQYKSDPKKTVRQSWGSDLASVLHVIEIKIGP